MKRKLYNKVCALSLLFLVTACLDDGKLKEFRVIDSYSGVHYAVIDDDDVKKRNALYEAAKAHCDAIDAKLPAPQTCYVVFWKDVNLIPDGLDMTEESRKGQVALYTREVGKRAGFYFMNKGTMQQ